MDPPGMDVPAWINNITTMLVLVKLLMLTAVRNTSEEEEEEKGSSSSSLKVSNATKRDSEDDPFAKFTVSHQD